MFCASCCVMTPRVYFGRYWLPEVLPLAMLGSLARYANKMIRARKKEDVHAKMAKQSTQKRAKTAQKYSRAAALGSRVAMMDERLTGGPDSNSSGLITDKPLSRKEKLKQGGKPKGATRGPAR